MQMQSQDEIVKKIINALEQQELLTFIDIIYLFGSRARNDADERSDIDLAIMCPTASKRNWLDIINAIDEVSTLLKIDTVRLEEASKELQDNVRKEGRVVYEK